MTKSVLDQQPVKWAPELAPAAGWMNPATSRGNLKPLMNVKCPTCKKSGDWFAGPFGPFCSRRCKLVDMGKWFSEEHLIARPIESADLQSGLEQSERAEEES